MNFIEAAQILIPTLSKLPMTVWEGDEQTLKNFEEKFCLFPQIQPLYTAEGLQSFFRKKDGQRIYVVSDKLNTHAVIAKCGTCWVILGPFVCNPWQDSDARIRLVNCGVQESAFLPYKIYRCNLPYLEQEYVVQAAELLLENTIGNSAPYELEAIDMEAQVNAAMDVRIAQKHEEAEVIQQRYANEMQIIEAVSQGNTAQAMQLFETFNDDSAIYHFATDKVSDWIASAAITRTWVRLGAMKAGISPVVIDSISQEYAQQMHHSADERILLDLQRKFLFEFCGLIRKHNRTSYSPYVKRAVEYINTHVSQDITIYTLCEINHLTRKHFAKLFHNETGKTVKQYVMQVRCQRAAELLENSQLLIQDISRYVGYEDNNYFTKVFKSVIGVTPQEYRKGKTFYSVP